MNETVWVTGASSGLGLHTAQALQNAGFRVVAGARSFADEARHTPGQICLPLDVTCAGSMDAFVREATARCGAPYALVNCAGVLVLGACESYAPEEIRRVMETNFMGQAAMIASALPLMRARGEGRIVNFSSINGLLGIPFQGAYVASKHAVEGFSECLALEAAPFGVQVTVVEPGDHRSGAQTYRLASRGMTPSSPYWDAFEAARGVIARDEAGGSDPDALGRRIARILRKKRMPQRLRVAKADQHLAVVLHDVLPNRLFARIIGSYYRPGKRRDGHA